MKIEIFEWEAGDWVVMFADGKVIAQGHSITTRHWLTVLKSLGAEVERSRIDDDGPLCFADVETLREAVK